MLSGILIFNQKGENLIFRAFRNDCRPRLADVFRIQVISNAQVRSPVLTLGSTTFSHVKHENIYLVAITKSNANAALVFEFLYRLIALGKGYFGKFDEEAVKNNFVLVYELLDEILDFGYPQNTETDTLKMYITTEGVKSLGLPLLGRLQYLRSIATLIIQSDNYVFRSALSNMPAVRRWRILAFSIIFTLLVISYIDPSHKIRNYCFLCQHPSTSVTIPNDRKINWSEIPVRHPVTSYIPLPVGQAKKIPKVQAPAPQETTEQNEERTRRRELVRESFNHSWNGYKQNAWLHDEVRPLSGKGIDPFGGWAATLVDSLDSLWIMGMKDEFEDAVLAATSIDFSSSRDGQINVFETTIRYLGGFLAAYDISGGKYESLLTKATEIGDLLIRSFDTPNRMPVVRWNWELYIEGTPQVASKRTLLSELGSLSLEFTRLSQLTGEAKFYDAIQRISNELEKSQSKTKLPGMWPVSIDASIPSFDTYNFITLGGMSDSLYEYLPKQYLLLGGLLSQPRTLYEDFITVAKKHLFTRFYNEQNKNLTISGDVHVTGTVIRQEPRGQHLTCFTGGMVALASKIFSRPDELALAEELTQGCIWTYDVSPNGIGPEIFTVMPCPQDGSPCTWDDNLQQTSSNKKSPTLDSPSKAGYGQDILKSGLPKGFTAVQDHRYLLRPEAIESVFILYRITGNQMYADAAWRMFEAVELASRTPIAAAGIQNVMVKLDFKNPEINAQRLDSMESFWLAETLKYFFLCFEEWDVVSLDDWVLNTEAHPFKRPKP